MQRDIAFFIAGYGDGGVEKMLVRLATGLAVEKGLAVDFLVPAAAHAYLSQLPESVRVIPVPDDSYSALSRYVEERPPRRLITGKPGDEVTAVRVMARHRRNTRLFCRIGVPQLHRVRQRTRNPLRRWRVRRNLAKTYRHVDGFLTVSRRTADELTRELGVPDERVWVLPNPVIDDSVLSAAVAPCPHPWLDDDGPPVILGMGGLRRQKDFKTLVAAFARLRRRRDARLLIVGEGRQAEQLRRLADTLGVGPDVDLPGFSDNPYSYMSRAALFALSSRWEGQPNVLIEAMAQGTPVVSTDCVSGPREILEDGRFGQLVPVGDVAALARAMEVTLENPLSAATLRAAVAGYTVSASVDAYARALGLSTEHSAAEAASTR